MTASLLIAPAASGKTHTCIQRITGLLARQPLAKIWVVVPGRLQAAQFRRQLASAGGGLGVHVVQFFGLFQQILDSAGRPACLGPELAFSACVRQVVTQAAEKNQLAHFAAIQSLPGFSKMLRGSFAELKRNRVSPADLAQIAGQDPALGEIAALYRSYQDLLGTLNWEEREGLAALAESALVENPRLLADWDLLVVDGFDLFNPSQAQVLALAAARPKEVLITLPGTPAMSRPAHRRFIRSLQQLRGLQAQTCTLPEPHTLPGDLGFVEQRLFEPNPPDAPRPERSGQVTLLEARSPQEEAREALRWFKARILRDGVPPARCAIFSPSPESYHPFLRSAAAEFGLALEFSQQERLSEAPSAAALRGLLELSGEYARRPLLETLRSPYFDFSSFGFQPGDPFRLEYAGYAAQIIAGRSQWEEALSTLAGTAEENRDAFSENEDELSLSQPPRGASAARLLTALQAFFERIQPPAGEQPASAWVEWLQSLLDELGFFRRAASTRDEAGMLSFIQTLRSITLSEEALGAESISYETFMSHLNGLLQSQANGETLSESSGEAVQVFQMLELRGLRFEAVAVLGLSEGVFPAVEREDPWLSETVRAALGMETRRGREQAGLFYQAVTRPDRFLLLTRPYLTPAGEEWESSPYWKAVQSLFNRPPARITGGSARPLEEAASPQEALAWANRVSPGGELPPAFASLSSRWRFLQQAGQVTRARTLRRPPANHPFEGWLPGMQPEFAAGYGPQFIWSPTRLETYNTCPFEFLVRYGLKLEAVEAPAAGLDAASLGTLLHGILQDTYAALSPEQRQDESQVEASLQLVAQKWFLSAPARLGFRPSVLWVVQQNELAAQLTRVVRSLANMQGNWKPLAFEQVFGRDGFPPLALNDENGKVLVNGVIDRLDVNDEVQIRVMDYKSGSSHLAKSDFQSGRRVQIALYTLAARQVLALGEAVEGVYFPLLSASAKPVLLSKVLSKTGEDASEEGSLRQAVGLAVERCLSAVHNIREARFTPRPPSGGCPSWCPAASWCWRFDEERTRE